MKTTFPRLSVLLTLSFLIILIAPSSIQAQNWYNTSWLYRKAITIDYTKVGTGPHTNFPVLVSFTDPNLQTGALANAYDIVFTSSDGSTKLNYEVENYTSSNGSLVAWVQVPILSSSVSTVIYMYYGNASATTSLQNVTGTWDANFKGVWHMNAVDAATIIPSSISTATDGANDHTTNATGKISNGRATGINKLITIPGFFGSSQSVTLSGWAKMTSNATNGEIISLGNNVGLRLGWAQANGFKYIGTGWFGTAANVTNSDLNWHYITYTCTNGAQILYRDGVLANIPTSDGNPISYTLGDNTTCIGRHGQVGGGFPFEGTLDEVRVSNSVRSPGWIQTEYNNQNSPSTFYTLGAQACNAPSVSATSAQTCTGGTITVIATGGISPYSYNLNGGADQASPVFMGKAAGTYTVNVKGSNACVASTSVPVVAYVISTDDPATMGNDSWIGHMYDNQDFTNYFGHFNESANFDENFGGDDVCFSVASGASTQSVLTQTFSVKFRMKSSLNGIYVADIGSDDGSRLYVDGIKMYDNYTDHALSNSPRVLMNLNGTSILQYDYYENGAVNRAYFNNLTLVLANILSTNLSQNMCTGINGVAISGDAGVTMNGINTTYQWSWSSTPGGPKTDITGAAAATYLPLATDIPFNNPGTYYIYRTAIVKSTNNIAPNPYTITKESNAATVIVTAMATISAAGLDQTGTATCGVTSVTLAANTASSGTGLWSVISGAGGSFSAATSSSSNFTGTAGSTYTLRWSISNNYCISSDDVIVTFNKIPSTANANIDQTGASTCGATTVTLAANTPTTGTGLWTIVSGTGGSFSAATNSNSNFTGTAGSSYTLRWTISNSPCTPASFDDVVIIFNKIPTTSNAGPDQTSAATCGLTSVTLGANNPATGTGTGLWTIVSGTGGSLSAAASNVSGFSGMAGNTYTLRWTITNGPCTPSTDDVVITLNQAPSIANAGADQSGTATCGLTTLTLAANAPVIGTAAWSIVSGTGGTLASSASPASSFSGTAGASYTLRWTISNGVCSSFDDVIVTFNQYASLSGSATETCVGGSTGIITATAAGGTLAYAYSLDAVTYQTSSVFNFKPAGNYTLYVKTAANCVTSASVTVKPYATSTDFPATPTDTWTGLMYDGNTFDNYLGYFTETESFNEVFIGNTTCFPVTSNSISRSIYTETFSVRYNMKSTRKGLYTVDLGSDDGSRLKVDNILVYNNWILTSFISKPSVLVNLTGSSLLEYEFYENTGDNRVVFQNPTLILANTLSVNISQAVCTDKTGLVISGDVYGTLPTGISLSGTGYQWTYSVTPTGVRTNITGATGATFTPSAAFPPFNTAGTYYTYRNAILTSANNVISPAYSATNESNPALITVTAASAASINYLGSPFCSNILVGTVTRTGTAGGIFTTDAALNINAGTGAINWTASTKGDYIVNYSLAAAGGCSAVLATANVKITLAPFANGTYADNPYCTNEGTIYPTGTFLGALGTLASTTGLSITPATGAVNTGLSTAGTYTVTYTVDPSGGCPQYKNYSSITIVTPGTWLGTVSPNWNTAGNWPCGIPGNSTDVSISTGTPFAPSLSSAPAGSVKSININSGASLTITGATLEIAGTITNGGTFNVADGSITFNGSSAQIIPATAFTGGVIKNITINNTTGVGLTGPLGITGILALTSGTFTTNENLTLKSTAAGTASLAPVTGSISGNVIIERYIPARRAWRLLSAPIQATGAPTINKAWQEGVTAGNPSVGYGVQIVGGTTANGFDIGINNNASVKFYNAGTGALTGVPNTNVLPITTYPGYFLFVRGNRSTSLSQGAYAPTSATTLRMKGLVNTGNFVASLNGNTYQLVGNPYPSPVNFQSLLKSGVNDKLYVWDPKLVGNNNGVGGYVTLILNTTTSLYDITPLLSNVSPVSQYIASGEAFFVELSSGAKSPSITFKESDKITLGDDHVFRPTGTNESLRINLFGVDADGSATLSDGVLTTYSDINNNAVDKDDAVKFSNSADNICLVRNGSMLAIERRKAIEGADTAFLNLYTLGQQEYQLQITAEGLENNGLYAVVKDNYSPTNNNTRVNLGGITYINFKINTDPASYVRNRFSIVFSKPVVLPVTFTAIKASNQQKDIVVEWKTANELNVKEYGVQSSSDGIHFTTIAIVPATAINGAGATYLWPDENVVAGLHFYRVKAMETSGSENYSSVLKVNTGTAASEITVYPNPVTGGKINLQMSNMPSGKYFVRLLSPTGQELLTKEINHVGGIATENMLLPGYISKGMYSLEITHPGKSKSTIAVINQ